MRILIFGHRGFIGKELSAQLVKQDSFEILFYNDDILNIDKLKQFALSCGLVDILIHCAGKYDGIYSELYDNNYRITQNILNVFENMIYGKFIYLSTGAVYCQNNFRASDENDIEYPETDYGKIKYLCEKEILDSRLALKTEVFILRLPSVYGIQNNKGIIFNFLNSIKTDFVINVHGDGSQKRSFLNINDLVNAIMYIIEKKDIVCADRIFNISECSGYSISDIANFINENWAVQINFMEKKNGLNNMVLKSEKIRSLLGWNSKCEVKRFLHDEIEKITGTKNNCY